MVVHTVTGLLMRLLLGAVVDADQRGVLTPELWGHVEAILQWCSSPGSEVD